MSRIRAAVVAAVASLALVLGGSACTSPEQGTAERSTSEEEVTDESTESPASEEGQKEAEEAPDTELRVGDTFRYVDGLKLTVTRLTEITSFGEFDTRPEADRLAFRVHLRVANDGDTPVDLDGFHFSAVGATTGGDTRFLYVTEGSKEMAGRLAPGRSADFTEEFSIDRSDGREVVVQASRFDGDVNVFAEPPKWTGAIR
ncbi:hypothetical protein [Streptomyces alkaliterrae]|uniref:DUF4352 domain-containing protein n=1 Tax=Streptomyces alkaliterrae TaxID=2213162 RepID=A0A5P0YL27_9ACTN|nr:hypothetical protein [Streptomyces alkaliterrae]MBB1256517.1 hypothetical protein [Streptomyces alkaliterrae]MBB1262259.1 hypothetical protein [Streptomyces alkaliterrae]MQS00347.1 hypothetical protein [Streptomyces alkaliterrae]